MVIIRPHGDTMRKNILAICIVLCLVLGVINRPQDIGSRASTATKDEHKRLHECRLEVIIRILLVGKYDVGLSST